ncbi:hypothetical protein PENSTE_c004G08300 [Penicillium steckii]|uniref:Carrier domain-containing protein n=1 Tax=Penicillium steckii TaxID=303698 RepID=A0A1V6TMX2_9EURO|nr:hypothetical protein PENSTE_c004G08300 [Penicillium steckii]
MSFLNLDYKHTNEEPTWQRAHCVLPEHVVTLCKGYGWDLPAFYQQAWAIVLSRYTSSNSVTFAVSNDEGKSAFSTVCEATVDAGISITDLVTNKYGSTTLGPSSPETSSCNTGILFRIWDDGLLKDSPLHFVLSVSTHGVELLYTSGISSLSARNLVSALEMVFIEMANRPEQKVKDLYLLSKESKNQILEWHRRPRTEDVAPVVDAIKGHALLQPTNQAVCAWDGNLTYAELDDVTSRLAHYLRSMNVIEDTLVLVGLEKSMNTVISIVSILKAGAAFVPVSPTYPTERMQAIKDTTNPVLAITSPEFTTAFECVGSPVLELTSSFIASLPNFDPVQNKLPSTDLQRLAYVLFTSGSTGRPKGVAHSHKSLSALINQADSFGIHSSSRVLQFAPSIFAASLVDTVLPLIVGATVCLAPQNDLMNQLEAVMDRYQVTFAMMTPSATKSINPALVTNLERLFLVGEPVNEATLNKWAGNVKLMSGYGLSEVVGAACTSELQASKHSQNIGFSAAGRVWLADPINIQQPAPIGSIGEILFYGDNIGRGYLNDPEKTASMYIEPPEWVLDLSIETNGKTPPRVVRTGDLGRYMEDGSIVYIGRKDTQVKIRGKRVELGEIEGQIRLQRAPEEMIIVEAVTPSDMGDTTMLVCFIHSKSHSADRASFSSPFADASRAFINEIAKIDPLIRAALPDFMVPSLYIPLAQIPKTPSGKTDRLALRRYVAGLTWQELEVYVHGGDAERIQPQNDIQRSLQTLFSQVLNRAPEAIGIHDQFLKLGGDSIQAIRLVQSCRSHGLHLAVEQILESGTISQLAEVVREAPKTSSEMATDETIPISAAVDQLSRIGISTEDVEAIDLCSGMQEGILMSQLKSPNQHALRALYELHFSNHNDVFDEDRLKAAWKQVTGRHPLLRSIFLTNVTPQVFALQIQLRNESSLQYHTMEEGLDSSEIFRRRRSDQSPSTLPQLSAHIVPSGGVYVEIELSHSVTDGMSMSNIMKDLCAFYSGNELPPLTFRHSEYTAYKKQALKEDSLSYWKEYLGGMDPCQFPTSSSDSYSPSVYSNDYDTSDFKAVMVDVGPAEYYQEFVRNAGVSLASVIKLAWQIVLRETTRTDDVCFGYLISGRDAPIDGIIDAVGPLIDLMICRQKFEANVTVADMLQSIQSDFVRGLPHRGVSFADIRRALDFGRDEVMFNTCITQYPLPNLDDVQEPRISLREVERHDPNEFDLGLEVLVSDHEISSRLKAYTSVVSVEQMERVGALFGHIMRIVVKNSHLKINELDLVSEKDFNVIKGLNDRILDSVDRCAHEIIHEQCLTQPFAPAVNAWDGDWTYKEFDEVSDAISQQLLAKGVTLETFVPVLMDKSRWVPISILGILKAGAAFVLLEPTQPIQRLHEICDDLRSTVIIASSRYQETAAALVDKVVVLDNQSSLSASEKHDGSLRVRVGPSNLAYVVFTSGSTGKPKGVMVEHRSLCSTGASMARHSPMDNNMRMFQYASFAFDVSVLDLAVCFMTGGCLCIPSFENRQNRLLESLNEFRANYVALTPTVTRTLQPEKLTSLKTLKVSGEALTASDIQRWGAAPGIQFINMYGPAECTINVTVQAPVTLASPALAIGYSMSNSTAWIVDPQNHERLCPVGAVGELVIQGPVVARGYLNRPEQTAASFIPPPQWLSKFLPVNSDEKLYKTGDLVQYNSDGMFLYKGRKDSQVKLRGQRLELGEVEEHLRRVFPDASEVIAEVASLNQGKSKALAAFVCQQSWGGQMQDPSSLSHHDDYTGSELLHPACDGFFTAISHAKSELAASLPSYMEPTIYLPLSRVPQTRSGKTDRGQLRRIVSSGVYEQWASSFQIQKARKEPRSEAESVLCQSIADILDLNEKDLSMDDNFFRRAGDSVAAMMLVSMLREKGYHITVADIFQHPQLDSLAGRMHSDLPSSVSEVPPPFSLLGDDSSRQTVVQQTMEQCGVSEKDIEDIYPCSPLQHAFFLFSASKKGTLIAQFAYNLRSTIDLDLLRKAWDKTVLAHPQLRTRIVNVEGKDVMHQAVLHQTVEIEYYEPPADVSPYVPDLPIDVAPGKPLLRIALVRRPGTDEHRLVISLQHSMYDGWSLALLMKELERAYSGDAMNHLPTSSFIRYLDQTKDTARQFWTEQLKDLHAPNFPRVPPSGYIPHPSATLNREVVIPPVSSGQITLSTKIRWAWAQVLSLYTGSSEVALGLGTAGRGTPVAGIERMMTPTLGIFPYRLYIDPEETVIDALRKDQQHYVRQLPHEHYGNSNISRLATGSTSAAALQTLLIVQPQEPEEPSSLYSEQELLPQTGAFHVRALSLHCYLQRDSVKVFACYDDGVLSEKEMNEAISLFEVIFQQICSEPETSVGQLRTSLV